MENGKVLPFLIFNIHPVVPAAVFALVMDIVAVNRPVTGLLMAATQTAEIGVILIRCHHTRAVALGAFHLNAGGQGVVCTVCKVGFIITLLFVISWNNKLVSYEAEDKFHRPVL